MTTTLLLHGGFCRGRVWDDTVEALRADGRTVEALDLPSSGPSAAGLGDLAADVEAVSAFLDGSDDDVVLVGHSGAGMVLAELGDDSRVRHSVYLAALWPQAGQSAGDLLGGQLPEWMTLRDDGTVHVAEEPDLVHAALCHDIDRDRFLAEVYPHYVLTSMAGVLAPSSAPDVSHPSSYIVCEHDHAVPPEAQEMMAGAADHVHRLPSSHSPLFSMPRELAALIAAAH